MIFVTGGTGLVGSHVLLKLAQQDIKFKALKRPDSTLDVCRKIFNYYNATQEFDKIIWVDGDVNNIPSLEQGMKDCNLILHCAGLVSFSPSDAELLKHVNIQGTANVVNVALSCNVKKLGFVSSIAALGRNSTQGVVNEDSYFKATKLDSNYAHTKYLSEQEVWRASAEGLDVVIVNPSVILGPGDWKKGSSRIFHKIYNGLKFYTNGSTGYVDVDDVASSLIQLLLSEVKNERFIVNGANLKYRDCFDRIAEALDRPKSFIKVTPFLKEVAWRVEAIKALFTRQRPLITQETVNSAMTNSTYTTSKIEKAIGFEFTDIDVSIKKYANWFLADQV